MDDAAQSVRRSILGRKIGTIGMATATSFFPAKPLGCYGDGGAIFTDDDGARRRPPQSAGTRQGQAQVRQCAASALNGRLDTLQAAILIEKLAIFADEILARNTIARRYEQALADTVAVPRVSLGLRSVWAQYTVRLPAERRDRIAAALKDEGVPPRFICVAAAPPDSLHAVSRPGRWLPRIRTALP